METQNLVISFDYNWFLAKNLAYAECLILKFHYRNSSIRHYITVHKNTYTLINFHDNCPTYLHGYLASKLILLIFVSRRRSNSNQRISGRPPSGRGDADCTFDWLLIPGMLNSEYIFTFRQTSWLDPKMPKINCIQMKPLYFVNPSTDFVKKCQHLMVIDLKMIRL